jgi:hypothetical protein
VKFAADVVLGENQFNPEKKTFVVRGTPWYDTCADVLNMQKSGKISRSH